MLVVAMLLAPALVVVRLPSVRSHEFISRHAVASGHA